MVLIAQHSRVTADLEDAEDRRDYRTAASSDSAKATT